MVNLVADIGGTNSRLALANGTQILRRSIRRFEIGAFETPDALLRHYCETTGAAFETVCVACAGPVQNGTQAHLTNRGWSLDLAGLRASTGARRAMLMNDLTAQGYALDAMPEAAFAPIRPGHAVQGATRLVIGIGTGFNVAPVYRTPAPFAAPAEAGHALLPARSDEERALAAWLSDGAAVIEDLISGRGLERAYGFHARRLDAPPKTTRQIFASIDTDPASKAALQSVCGALGTVAANLAVIHYALGGIILTGGMAQALAPHLMGNGFKQGFVPPGSAVAEINDVPVALMTDDYAALWGCAAYLGAIKPE